MFYVRFRQNLLHAVVLLLLTGALMSSSVPQATVIRTYIRYALSTDFDLKVVADKAKGLGSFSSRVSWQELRQALVVGRTPVSWPWAGR